MRKLIVSVSLLFIFTTFAFAQIEEEKWQTYSPVNEEFSVEIPLKMSETANVIDPTKKIYYGNYQAALNGSYYFIFSENSTNSAKPIKGSYSAFSLSNQHIEESIKEYNPVKKLVSINVFDGEQYGFVDNEGFFQQILTIRAKNRSYIIHTFAEKENDAGVNRFFGSLIFFENEELTKISNKPPEVQKTNVVNNSGNGSGSGGAGNGTKLPVPIPTNNRTDSKIFKIFSIPPATYTAKARTYGVSGTVRLRVVFLLDGTIGTITPIKKLPLGLTNSAIKAAKSIEFQAGTANISKTVEYRFTLY
jgi:Gram-negative bacterial TonB protein C-terminal